MVNKPERRPLDVLSIHWGFIPGGVAVYARYLEKVGKYAPIKIRSLLINSPDWPLDQANLKELDVRLITIRNRTDVSWVRRVRDLIKQEKPRLIMAHGFNGCFVAVVGNIGLGVPIVSSWHGDYIATTLLQKLRKPIFSVLLRFLFKYFVGDIVTVSSFSKKRLTSHGIGPDKIQVIHHGLPPISKTVSRRNVREELGLDSDHVLIGTACRLVAKKGLEDFLDAISKVQSIRPNTRFIIWGDGPLRGKIEWQAKKLAIDKSVFLLGYQPNVSDFFSDLDIFVLPSLYETFSLVVLEAMRVGLPIISTSVGGIPELIKDGVSGVLVPPGNHIALMEAILRLVDDPELCKLVSANAKSTFLNSFALEKMVKSTADWLVHCSNKYSTNRPSRFSEKYSGELP